MASDEQSGPVSHGYGEILISEDAIRDRVKVLGALMTRDYAGRPPLLVGVLKGAWIFLADLARAIDLDVEVDFMAVSSYGDATSSTGVVRIVMDLDQSVEGRDVVLVEDIVDSGLTLDYLESHLQGMGAASVEACALLVREGRQHNATEIKYVGFEIPPAFVVGYGLDAGQYGRNLPFVAEYKPG